MTEITLNTLSEIINGKLKGNKNILISEIIIDSRTPALSSKQLFFALKGQNRDGHKFIPDLYDRGVRGFVVSDKNIDFSDFEEAGFVFVDDTLEALHKSAAFIRSGFKNHLTAIVGSNGKTIVKEWLFQLLKDDYKIIRSPKSYNSQTGIPLSLSLLDNKYDFAFTEAGISRKGEMEKAERMIKPDTVIFVSLGEAHQENFLDKEEKAEEKLKIAKDAEQIIMSFDYTDLEKAFKKNPELSKKKIFRWSVKDKTADLYLQYAEKKQKHTKIRAVYQNKNIDFKLPFTDEASIKNSLSCLSFLLVGNLFSKKHISRFETLEPVEMRIEQKQGINNCLLINDTYNSDIISLKIALDTLNYQSAEKKKTLILSDIFQSGTSDEELYGQVAEYVKKAGITKFTGIGKSLQKHKKLFSEIKESYFFETTDEFLNSDLKYRFKNENILIKGSRTFEFERISDFLQLKKHRTVLEINTEALIHNFNYYKSLLKKGTKVTVMVKALSYGSGTYEIAKLLQYHNVDYLGVAFTDEGVKLRKSGIDTGIIVMNPDEYGFSDIIDYRLEPEIYGFGILDAFARKAEKSSRNPVPVHLKIDTGMKRLGFCDYEIDELILSLKQYPQIYVKTVFSHLAASDEPDKDNFTRKQIAKFTDIADKIISSLPYHVDRHILNSSGIERFPEAAFEMVRLGIGLYGFGSHSEGKLMNVSSLKTHILQIKKVKKGETVGYGRAYKAEKDMRIAVLPAGYADGFSRALSNGVGEVLISGQKCPIVGNVCMDMCMADITNVTAEEGDEVIIFGDDYPASKIAEKLNTIPYEIITGIPERVKRVYIG
ncbi:MAG: bifunctional UDP-N-acetylmuramoyl-tripeptide:D-alanyl-D-alanine ligase/alanine racemase [Chlorobi bacterium]|nr:bifunctional UDP-N-acetylmuramoyl-tripeptide:D-alanyl-D-alanine ligase/alanine racemase [Chlorobiota bacterium]